MKRFMSVALATAMIASMGITAFADQDYDYDVSDIRMSNSKLGTIGGIDVSKGFGVYGDDEYYFLLAITEGKNGAPAGYISDNGMKDFNKADTVEYDEIEDIDDLKVNIKFTDGEEYVADYYIDEIDEDGGKYEGLYAIILELNDNYTTKKQKIKGEVTLKNKTKKLGDERDFTCDLEVFKAVVEEGNDAQYDVSKYDAAGNVTGAWTQAEINAEFGTGYVASAVQADGKYYLEKDGVIVVKNVVNWVDECDFDDEDVYIHLIEFNDLYNVADFSADVENIELEDDNGFYFDVKASDQGKLNLTYDNVAIKSVARMAPVDADLTFFNFYGYPEFDFTGKVTLTPEEDDVEYFVYAVNKDGSISKVNAKLNDDGDAYEFKTRTLGCYVLTDMELDVEEESVEAPVVDAPVVEDAVVAPETGKTNPGTGC